MIGFRRIAGPRRAASLVSYAALTGLIAAGAVGAVASVGDEALGAFSGTASILSGEVGSAVPGNDSESEGAETALVSVVFKARVNSGRTGINTGKYGKPRYGNLLAYDSDLGGLVSVNSASNGRTYFNVLGDHRTEFAGAAVFCDGVEYPGASIVFADGGFDRTFFRWTGSSGPIFQGGKTYSCEVGAGE